MKAESYAAGTVINALATYKGVAFGIDLRMRAKFRLESDAKKVFILEDDELKTNPLLNKVFRNLSGVIEIKSEIPEKSGLGSSSAFMNVLLILASKARGFEIDAERILRSNARISLELGLSYTGAFDDASASLLGGMVFSDNLKMKLIKREEIRGDVLILLPEYKRGVIDLRKIKEGGEIVEKAFELAKQGKFKEAMLLNSMHYCEKLRMPIDPIIAVQSLNVNAGLSGNGPSYVAFGDELNEVEEIWSSFGKVLRRRIVNEPVEKLKIPKTLFFKG